LRGIGENDQLELFLSLSWSGLNNRLGWGLTFQQGDSTTHATHATHETRRSSGFSWFVENDILIHRPLQWCRMVDVCSPLNISERVAHFRNKKSEDNDRLLDARLKKLVQPHPANTNSGLKLFWIPDATYIFVMFILDGEVFPWGRSSLGDRLPGGCTSMEMYYLCFCTYKWIFGFHDSNLFMRFPIC
jgi:hypothetical protein